MAEGPKSSFIRQREQAKKQKEMQREVKVQEIKSEDDLDLLFGRLQHLDKIRSV